MCSTKSEPPNTTNPFACHSWSYRLFGPPVPRRRQPDLPRLSWFATCLAPPFLSGLTAVIWLWAYQGMTQDAGILEAMGDWFAANTEFLPAVFTVDGRIGLGRLLSATDRCREAFKVLEKVPASSFKNRGFLDGCR